MLGDLNLHRECLAELQKFLKTEIGEFSVVVMPDFFLDRLISLNMDAKTLYNSIGRVAKKKGGSVDGIKQTDLRGGNAVNTASALAALGARVTPIICTDKLGLQLTKYYLRSKKTDLSHIKVFKEASVTTALELEAESGKVNIMLRDVGALADFGSDNLNDKDFEAIENADYVCVFNWAGTRRFGTELAKSVFHRTKVKGKGKTYYDTADPTPNREKLPALMKNVLLSKNVDILSINENEAVCFAKQLNYELEEVKKGKFAKLAMESARILARHFQARVDLHTTSFSATFTKKGETAIPAFRVRVLRATGAGDAWNAGNILGDACELSDEQRLALANAVAAYYISAPAGMHPTSEQLIEFCSRLQRKSAE